MRREDLKVHEIRKRIVAKDCVNTVIIPMAHACDSRENRRSGAEINRAPHLFSIAHV
jgi:hypothetical protein